MLTAQTQRVVDRLYEQDEAERAAGLPSSQRMRSVGRETGHFLNLTARALGARRVLEIGSSSGLSTIMLAAAVEHVGGQVIGTEIDPARAERANHHLAAAGLANIGRVIPVDARTTLANLHESFDLVFIDAEKDDYVSHFQMAWPLVRLGGLILADNVISHDLSAYQAMLRGRDDVDTLTLPLERGIEMTVKLR